MVPLGQGDGYGWVMGRRPCTRLLSIFGPTTPHHTSRAPVQTTASEAHVRQALELFKTSTMDAVKSGLMDVAVFTDEQR